MVIELLDGLLEAAVLQHCCLYCNEVIDDSDPAMPIACLGRDGDVHARAAHRECMFRQVAGSARHQHNMRTYGRCMDDCADDPALTRRQQAIAAWDVYRGARRVWS